MSFKVVLVFLEEKWRDNETIRAESEMWNALLKSDYLSKVIVLF